MPMSETDPNELVHYSVENKVATITLNRPEKLNAFSDELVVALNTMLHRFDADPEAFTAIIHGAGRAFSTGADVHQRQLRKREEFERLGGPQGHGAHASDLFVRSVKYDVGSLKSSEGAIDFRMAGKPSGLRQVRCPLARRARRPPSR